MLARTNTFTSKLGVMGLAYTIVPKHLIGQEYLFLNCDWLIRFVPTISIGYSVTRQRSLCIHVMSISFVKKAFELNFSTLFIKAHIHLPSTMIITLHVQL